MRASWREIQGWTPTIRQVNRISHGAAAAKTPAGSASSKAAPPIAPIAQVRTTAIVIGRETSRSSRRYPNEPLNAPGSSPIVFDALATTGGIPSAIRAGKLINDATPTVEVSMPAPSPAAMTASCSGPVTTARAADRRRTDAP